MARSGHRGVRKCPICGEHYIHTNWMVLRNKRCHGGDEIVQCYYAPSASGVLTVVRADDTHIRACARKRQLAMVR